MHLIFVIFSLSFEQIVECFRTENGFTVTLNANGNIRVKVLDNTVNLFGKYHLESLNKYIYMYMIWGYEQIDSKASTWTVLDQNSSIMENFYYQEIKHKITMNCSSFLLPFSGCILISEQDYLFYLLWWELTSSLLSQASKVQSVS